MEFIYTGIDKNALRQKGTLDANSEREVIDFLRASEITPITVRKIENKPSLFSSNRVSNSDVIIFTRQLSSMALTGLTLIESLRILEKQVSSPGMRKIVVDLINQISEGATFSDALATHKGIFSDTYVALIRAAEKGGLLDKVLTRLADNMEKSDDLRKRVKSAM